MSFWPRSRQIRRPALADDTPAHFVFVLRGTRKRYSAAFKARVAREAAKQTRTLGELSKAFQVHPVQISQWKKPLRDRVESLVRDGRSRDRDRDQSEVLQAELDQQIGRLNMEVDPSQPTGTLLQ
jgi:transposase-like protein